MVINIVILTTEFLPLFRVFYPLSVFFCIVFPIRVKNSLVEKIVNCNKLNIKKSSIK